MNNQMLNAPLSWIGQINFSSIPGLKDEDAVDAKRSLLKDYISTFQNLQQPDKSVTGVYDQKYADLNAVMGAIQTASKSLDIACIQQPVSSGGKTGVHNYLINSKGAIFDLGSYLIEVSSPNPQKYGIALTYTRRYSISSIFGIAAGDDDDAQAFESRPDYYSPSEIKGLTVVYDGKAKDLTEVYALAMSGDILAKQILTDKSNSVRTKIAIKSIGDMWNLSKKISDESEKDKKDSEKAEKKVSKQAAETQPTKPDTKSTATHPKNSNVGQTELLSTNDDPFASIDKELNS